jgi:hypothetical protein
VHPNDAAILDTGALLILDHAIEAIGLDLAAHLHCLSIPAGTPPSSKMSFHRSPHYSTLM